MIIYYGGCDLQLQNFIEIQYKELAEHGSINDKFIELYATVKTQGCEKYYQLYTIILFLCFGK